MAVEATLHSYSLMLPAGSCYVRAYHYLQYIFFLPQQLTWRYASAKSRQYGTFMPILLRLLSRWLMIRTWALVQVTVTFHSMDGPFGCGWGSDDVQGVL